MTSSPPSTPTNRSAPASRRNSLLPGDHFLPVTELYPFRSAQAATAGGLLVSSPRLPAQPVPHRPNATPHRPPSTLTGARGRNRVPGIVHRHSPLRLNLRLSRIPRSKTAAYTSAPTGALARSTTTRSSSLPPFDAPNRPSRMFRNQRLRIPAGPLQRRQRLHITQISQRHTHVPQKPTPFRAQHRRSRKPPLEPHSVQRKQLQQIRRRQVRPPMRRQKSPFPREPIPRTHRQTIVAPEDTRTHRHPQLLRNRALQLDRQIRNASTRIQPERRGNRTRGTRHQTPRATPTAVRRR